MNTMSWQISNQIQMAIMSNYTDAVKNIYREYAMSTLNQTLVTITCILSMLGSLAIIGTFVAWRDIRTITRHVLVCLSVADFLIVLGNICGTYFNPTPVLTNDNKCKAQSFVTTSASIISCFWTTTLALYLYLTVVKGRQILAKKLLPLFHIINWLVGPIINIIALTEGMLGNSSDEITAGWCWIYHDPENKSKNKEILWMLFDGKLAEIIAYSSILIFYLLIKMKIHRELRKREKLSGPRKPMEAMELAAARNADRKLILIPVLLIFARIWGTFRFFLFCANKLPAHDRGTLSTGHKILLTLQGIGDSSQGLLNCILFCFLTPTIYNRLKDAVFNNILCCKRKLGRCDLNGKIIANDEVFGKENEEQSSAFTDPLLVKKRSPITYGTYSK